MSRLIDAGLLLDHLSGRLESMKDYDAIKDVVNNMPNAYDMDNVTEQLKDHAIEFEAFGQCSNYVELSHAIAIVKGGGADD